MSQVVAGSQGAGHGTLPAVSDHQPTAQLPQGHQAWWGGRALLGPDLSPTVGDQTAAPASRLCPPNWAAAGITALRLGCCCHCRLCLWPNPSEEPPARGLLIAQGLRSELISQEKLFSSLWLPIRNLPSLKSLPCTECFISVWLLSRLFALPLILSSLIMMCLGTIFFAFILFGELELLES